MPSITSSVGEGFSSISFGRRSRLRCRAARTQPRDVEPLPNGFPVGVQKREVQRDVQERERSAIVASGFRRKNVSQMCGDVPATARLRLSPGLKWSRNALVSIFAAHYCSGQDRISWGEAGCDNKRR